MGQITVFGDIHGNMPALRAVLADMDRRGLGERYCLGDLVGYGTFPNEVIAAIRGRKIPTIMGNYGQGVGHDSDDCGCAYRAAGARALGSGRQVVNAGSVGKPKDKDPRACYIVLSAEGRELDVQFVRVAYDVEEAALAVETAGIPAEYAQMLRQGCG
jgi:diadenosine tetraphosphatase ApaH/serine/threonine PP2A family protein phosphatase